MNTKNAYPFPKLTTDRLILRQLSDNDAKEIFSLRSDTEINKYLDRQPCKTIEDALLFIEKTNKHIKNSVLKYWAISLKDNPNLVGTICLFDLSEEHKKCEIGFELLKEYQGKGIMIEAVQKVIDYTFTTLELKTINAYTHKENQSSIHLLEKINFEKTGIIVSDNPDLIEFRLHLNQ